MDPKEQDEIEREMYDVERQLYTFDQISAWPASDKDTERLREYLAKKMQEK